MEKLKASGFHIGMASSAPKEKILQNLGVLELTDYFDIIVSGQEFVHSKPDPEIYIYTMKKMDVEPKDCYVVEDSTFGLQAAESAGPSLSASEMTGLVMISQELTIILTGWLRLKIFVLENKEKPL